MAEVDAARPMTLAELATWLAAPTRAEELCALAGTPCIFVELDGAPWPSIAGNPNCPVVSVTDRADVPDVVDVVVADADAGMQVAEAVQRNPIAAMVLVRLLRHNQGVGVGDRLYAESLAYSALQHGAEFRAWLQARTRREPRPEPDAPAVLLTRAGDELRITLNRPHKRNAYSSGLRDALCEALAYAVDDPSVARVVLDGAGASFSAGGDLDEFGEATDAGIAHASRMARSAGVLIDRLRDRIEARVHGACIGAGIELPAFAGRVVAREDAFFQLPEVGMGLIPGAGGTASILPRIGRRRLALMALTGMRVDASTALEWGLVDAIEN
ncbi:MAG: enoyl-CoA hydratase/isomerase family protein [Gammaproteobacteria bacterium]|nr:enoyl-CoA hydratase/isomerase family protein [Gammaproteobacteria bacterium]